MRWHPERVVILTFKNTRQGLMGTAWPCSIYQYSNMALRLSGQNCKFIKSLLSHNSQKRLTYEENNTKYKNLSWKPTRHPKVLIHRTWFIQSRYEKIYETARICLKTKLEILLEYNIYLCFYSLICHAKLWEKWLPFHSFGLQDGWCDVLWKRSIEVLHGSHVAWKEQRKYFA